MQIEECKIRIETEIDRLRDVRATGKHVIEVDMSQGGFVNVHFYRPSEQFCGTRHAVFSGGNGSVIVMQKTKI